MKKINESALLNQTRIDESKTDLLSIAKSSSQFSNFVDGINSRRMYKKIDKWGQPELPLNVTMQGLKSKKKKYLPIRNQLNTNRKI